jgi:LacI family gluconate utilization system Gnt-I transcriptional repressor
MDLPPEGWRKALEEAGYYDPALEWLNPASSSLALGSEMFQQMLAAQPDLNAIFFCNDDLAQGALMAALRHGVAVPERVAVSGFNDLTGSDQMLPMLTTRAHTPRRDRPHRSASAAVADSRRTGRTQPDRPGL